MQLPKSLREQVCLQSRGGAGRRLKSKDYSFHHRVRSLRGSSIVELGQGEMWKKSL